MARATLVRHSIVGLAMGINMLCYTDRVCIAVAGRIRSELGLSQAQLGLVFSIFFLAIYYSNAFDFNPLLGLCGYHFYEVQSEDGMTFLLMTRNHLLKPEQVAEVVQLFPYTFLNVGSNT